MDHEDIINNIQVSELPLARLRKLPFIIYLGGNIPPAQEDQRRLMARFMLTLAILFIIMIIIS